MQYPKILPYITTLTVVLFILYFSYLVLKPFLFIILTSLVFSIFLNPVYEWLFVRFKKAPIAAAISILLLLIFILTPALFIIGNIVSEVRGLVIILQEQPTLLNETQNFITQQMRYYGLPINSAQFNIQEEAFGFFKTTIQNVGATLLYTGSAVLNTFFVLITTYFFLTAKKRITTYFQEVEVIPHRHFTKIEKRTIELINGIVRGNMLVIGMQIIVGFIGFFIFKIPAPLLLAVLYGILSLLPAIGALLVWIPVAIFLFFTQGLLVTLFFIAWFVLSNLIIDTFIAPKIIGDQTKLHQLLIMFSVVGGIQQFGVIGIILGPIVVALAFVAIDIYKELAQTKTV